MPSAKNKKKLIGDILSSLKKGKVLNQFSELFLLALSPRSLQDLIEDKTSIKPILEKSYSFFETCVTSQNYQISISKPPVTDRWINGYWTLELTYPDAPHLLVTVQALLKELNLSVIRQLHPIIGVTRKSDGSIQELHPPELGKEHYSYVLFVLENQLDEQTIKTLQDQLTYHLQAVQYVHNANAALYQKLDEVKKGLVQSTLDTDIPKDEWVNLIDWLKNLNFSFFGYTTFLIKNDSYTHTKNSGIGLLSPDLVKQDNTILETLKLHNQRPNNLETSLSFDLIQAMAPVQRFENMMRLSFKLKRHNQVIEHCFLGILKRSSLLAKNTETPLIHLKMKHLFETGNMLPGSYNYNEVIRIFTDIPKFELFRTPVEDLHDIVENLFSVTDPNAIHCFHKQVRSNTAFFLIIVPTLLATRSNQEKIVQYFNSSFKPDYIEVVPVRSEDKSRLHIYIETNSKPKKPNLNTIEIELSERLQTWDQKVSSLLQKQFPGNKGSQLNQFYLSKIPDHYKARTSPEGAIEDIQEVDQLCVTQTERFRLKPFSFPKHSDLADKVSLLTVFSQKKLDLKTVMPIFQNFGFYVIDQLTSRFSTHAAEIASAEDTLCFIQSFRLTDENGDRFDQSPAKDQLLEALKQVFKNKTSDDPLNGLILPTEMSWRAVNVIQTYRNYFLHLTSNYSKEQVNEIILKHPHITALLFEYFNAKFNPEKSYGSLSERRDKKLPKIATSFTKALENITQVSEDALFQQLFMLMNATVRTNYFKEETETSIAIKIDTQNIMLIPEPRPFREIYINDVDFEGIHIRFGPVARGGLRWSDRQNDLRAEIMGLAKTQQIKNVVIVPVGSKGGFVIKTGFEVTPESGKHYYKKFITNLLSITDNMTQKNQVVSPTNVFIYDENDPYLVVAADKGTATFSDLANEIAVKNQFWLGNAFASGGSQGYDHKVVGITAKGAWECGKIHFQEANLPTEEATAVGIGDMSGDVFGNGFLLNEKVKLIAAFNHIHIFIDPNPDPDKSFKERNRLFKLPRSTWQDYDTKLMSSGGGIFSRQAKTITLSPEIKKRLAISKPSVSGEELIKAVLKFKADYIWFGGIGTYIKSDHETDLEVGDHANKSVRINASECRSSIIMEGANLGITQKGRLELSRQGVRLNTDAVDNSAGVNMSDYEVNLKILLQTLRHQNKIKTEKEIDALLVKAEPEVTDLVLLNNQQQHRQLSIDLLRIKQDFSSFEELITSFIDKRIISPNSDSFPDKEDISDMQKNFPRPSLSELQALVKLCLYDQLIETDIVNNPLLEPLYRSYFPQTILEKFPKDVMSHPLKQNILCMLITNKVINQAGSTALLQLSHSHDKPLEDVVLSYLLTDQLLDGESFRNRVLQDKAPLNERYKALIAFENIVIDCSRKFLSPTFQSNITLSSIVEVKKNLSLFKKSFYTSAKKKSSTWKSQGFSDEMDLELSNLVSLVSFPDVILVSGKQKLPFEQACQVVQQLNDLFDFPWLGREIRSQIPKSYWEKEYKETVLKDLYCVKYGVLITLWPKINLKKLNDTSFKSQLAEQKGLMDPFKTYFSNLTRLRSARKDMDLTALSVCLRSLPPNCFKV